MKYCDDYVMRKSNVIFSLSSLSLCSALCHDKVPYLGLVRLHCCKKKSLWVCACEFLAVQKNFCGQRNWPCMHAWIIKIILLIRYSFDTFLHSCWTILILMLALNIRETIIYCRAVRDNATLSRLNSSWPWRVFFVKIENCNRKFN